MASSIAQQIETLETYQQNFSDLPELKKGLEPQKLTTFQMNLGKLCNLACVHCHVNAGPTKTKENMNEDTVNLCLDVIARVPTIEAVDLTGGAPEMNPYFKKIVTRCRELGKRVIDRCNLVILEEPGYEHLYSFLAENQVEIVSSLPHYAQSKTDSQRGRGVFDKSVIALQKLNKLGYGKELQLHLVSNPSGLFLSGSQKQLEREFKENLFRKFGIVFNELFCINNLPINRFLDSLVRKKKFDQYMDILVNAYNPSTVQGLMCRSHVSVSYEGYLYDCDFNQMLEMKIDETDHIKNFDLDRFLNRKIKVLNHCYGCTAGAGSSCGGALE